MAFENNTASVEVVPEILIENPSVSVEDVSLRKLRPTDRDQWQLLYRGYMDFYGRPSESPEMYNRAWKRLLEDTVLHAFVARDANDHLVGLTHFLVHPNTSGKDVCYLQDLFTNPNFRGKGVGKLLINAVVEWSRQQDDIGRVYWLTHESNAIARKLYDKVAINKGFIKYQIDL